MKFVSSMLIVKNASESKRFYEELLGQKVVIDMGQNVTFDGFAIMEKSLWCQVMNKKDEEFDLGSEVAELYFEEDDMDELYARLKQEANIKFVNDMEEQPWGQRLMRIQDLDGYYIEIGENIEAVIRRFLKNNMSVEEVANKTLFDQKFIQALKDKMEKEAAGEDTENTEEKKEEEKKEEK